MSEPSNPHLGIAGRIAFGNPDKPGPPAKPGQIFELGKPLRQK